MCFVFENSSFLGSPPSRDSLSVYSLSRVTHCAATLAANSNVCPTKRRIDVSVGRSGALWA